MARFGSIGNQYFDNAGDPLVNGKLYFFESGTSIDKDTFADINLTIPNSNPVLLTAAGRQPNIFFNGAARVVLTDKNDVQIEERDPVGSDEIVGSFSEWDAQSVYAFGDFVVGPDSLYYQSIANLNQGNQPSIGANWWSRIDFVTYWNTNQLYTTNNPVIASNGRLYLSKSLNNQGNDPVSDYANWKGAAGDIDFFYAGKESDTSRSLTTTLTDDPDLIISLPPGVYMIVATLRVSAAPAADMRIGLNFTGSGNFSASFANGVVNGVLFSFQVDSGYVVFDSFSGTPTYTAKIDYSIEVDTAGDFSIQWAQDVSDAGQSTMRRGSTLIAFRVR